MMSANKDAPIQTKTVHKFPCMQVNIRKNKIIFKNRLIVLDKKLFIEIILKKMKPR